MQKIKKIDFLKKGYTDFFLTFFSVFSIVQSNIFNDKSHSYLKRNLTVDLVCRAAYDMHSMQKREKKVARNKHNDDNEWAKCHVLGKKNGILRELIWHLFNNRLITHTISDKYQPNYDDTLPVT